MSAQLLIEKVTQFGIVAGDKFYSVYDKVNTPDKLKAGQLIDAEIKTSKKGVDYINSLKVVDAPAVAKPIEAPKAAPVAAAPAPAAVSKPPFKKKWEPRKAEGPARDFDKEARGKTRCAMYEAALQSPVVAQLCLTVNGLDAALELVKQAAEEGFKFVFPDEEKAD